jgi:hypothetical protein
MSRENLASEQRHFLLRLPCYIFLFGSRLGFSSWLFQSQAPEFLVFISLKDTSYFMIFIGELFYHFRIVLFGFSFEEFVAEVVLLDEIFVAILASMQHFWKFEVVHVAFLDFVHEDHIAGHLGIHFIQVIFVQSRASAAIASFHRALLPILGEITPRFI